MTSTSNLSTVGLKGLVPAMISLAKYSNRRVRLSFSLALNDSPPREVQVHRSICARWHDKVSMAFAAKYHRLLSREDA